MSNNSISVDTKEDIIKVVRKLKKRDKYIKIINYIYFLIN